MNMLIHPPMNEGELPGQEALTSLEAYKAARKYIAAMQVANAAYDAAVIAQPGVESAQWDAMDAFDTAGNALLGLMQMLEQRGVLADIEGYLNVTYGRV